MAVPIPIDNHVLGNNYESFGCGDASLMGDRMTQTSIVPTPAFTQDDKHDSRINTHKRIAFIITRDYPIKKMLHDASVLLVRNIANVRLADHV